MTSNSSDIETRTLRQVAWRILPFLMLCYFIAFFDRVNAGFAALQMNHDIGLSATSFGLGGGLFYITYIIFEIPSNIALEKVGTRRWLARILVTWGLVACGMAFVSGPRSFYAARMLLGAAEAGFFPGVILYLTYWFPREYRGRIIAIFMVAIPASSFVGSPISAALLEMNGVLGFRGWQWMFVLEAVPAVLLGVTCLFMLPDGPQSARWLTAEQQVWLTGRLEKDRALDTGRAVQHVSIWKMLSNKYALAASLIYAGASGSSQVLSLWQPQIIKSFGMSAMQTGLLNSVPFGMATVLMVVWGRRSDVRQERVWHTAIPLALLAFSLTASIAITTLPSTLAILCLAVTATYIVKGPFWALSTEWLPPAAAAACIAQINAMGNLGGFVGTTLLGVIKDATGSYTLGLLPLALLSAIGFALVLVLGQGKRAAEESPYGVTG